MTRSNKTLVAFVVAGMIGVAASSAMAGGKNGLNLNFNKQSQGATLFNNQNGPKKLNNNQIFNNNQQMFKKQQFVQKQNFNNFDCHPKKNCYPKFDCYPKQHCSTYWGFNYCYTPTPVVYCDPYKPYCDPHHAGSLDQLQALIAARMAQSSNVVVGTWRSAPADGIQLVITLNPNRTFAWVVNADGKTSALSGTYTVAGSDLTLISGTDGDATRGTVVADPAGTINLAFANPTEPTMAITFAR